MQNPVGKHAQQVPKPPAPEPNSPGNIPAPPAGPDIPAPDPAPLPVENPGDHPLPPLTDPVIPDPGDPSTVPLRVLTL